jgi:Protein of unknown function (DUF2637)
MAVAKHYSPVAPPGGGDDFAAERRAARFFWAVLVSATCASVAGNVTHALLNAPARTAVIAAAAALVPPAVLLGATHSVAVLVGSRSGPRFTYWCALSMTLALALGAFVLSFDALRALAITAGIDADRAWLWPLVIDVSIAQATLALLSLTGGHRRTAHRDVAAPRAGPHASDADATNGNGREPARRVPAPVPGGTSDWFSFADLLISRGVTSIQRDKVAKVLAETAAKTPPTTIGRRWDVHHSTVKRIQAAAEELTG